MPSSCSRFRMSKPIQRWGRRFQIILICKAIDKAQWLTVSNPQKDYAYQAAKMILANSFTEYMAYVNAGVEYRFIRHQDLSEYENLERSDRVINNDE